jgi:hypothetical protein
MRTGLRKPERLTFPRVSDHVVPVEHPLQRLSELSGIAGQALSQQRRGVGVHLLAVPGQAFMPSTPR